MWYFRETHGLTMEEAVTEKRHVAFVKIEERLSRALKFKDQYEKNNILSKKKYSLQIFN